jgi:hypothetical protein
MMKKIDNLLNMVNYYPDFGKWESIDPERDGNDIYNRYAHINISLVEEKTTFGIGAWEDSIVVGLSCNDLDKWGVKYLITPKKLGVCGKKFNVIYEDGESSYLIYRKGY